MNGELFLLLWSLSLRYFVSYAHKILSVKAKGVCDFSALGERQKNVAPPGAETESEASLSKKNTHQTFV